MTLSPGAQVNAESAANGMDLVIEPASPQSFSSLRRSPISHNAHEHPLMQVDALRELARYLMPRKQCRFVDPSISIDSAFEHESQASNRQDIEEVFDRLDESGSWVALYNVEAHPAYQDFLAQVMQCAAPLIEPEQGRVFNVGGFIFLSTAPSVTPFHIDRENNFWLQIRGQKVMTVFDWRDRQVVAGPDVEHFIVNRGLDNVKLTDENRSRGVETLTSPGDGLYFPATSPHMTRCPEQWRDRGVSVSIGVVFYTALTRQMARVHQWNHWQRRLGVEPTFQGEWPLVDRVKSPAGRVLAGLKRRLRGYRPPPGSY